MEVVIPEFSSVRVLVVGDVMLDRYWQGVTSRISPEAPVPVVQVQENHDRAGGAGNVAVNLASLGVQVYLLGLVGDDEAGRELTQMLDAAGVATKLTAIASLPTVTKLRVLSRHQQLIRLDFEQPGFAAHSEALTVAYTEALASVDVVVLSDYGKGTLAGAPGLIEAARAAGKPLLVDPKGADFNRYRGAGVITPNLAELEAVVGPVPDQAVLERRGAALCAELDLTRLLVTRGENGMTLVDSAGNSLHLSARAREVFDVTGAGDTVIAVLAAGLGAGLRWEEAAALANLAAGIVVGKLGAASVTAQELADAVDGQRRADDAVVDEGELLRRVAEARRRGQRIVMTNGCFDVLHRGHVAYLEQAKRLGDRLIVAVNDDASVRRLKGAGRPLNPAADRMALLSAMRCVDWVVPFSEDTPSRLIGRVLPDVLVKGGDYRPQDIAGYEAVTAAGGEVRVLDFLPGYSTTALLTRAEGPAGEAH